MERRYRHYTRVGSAVQRRVLDKKEELSAERMEALLEEKFGIQEVDLTGLQKDFPGGEWMETVEGLDQVDKTKNADR